MSRPTLVNGDIWTPGLANASIRPQPGTNDDPGYFLPLFDTGLNDTPGNIKSNFYGWFNRLKLQSVGGLGISFLGAPIRNTQGNIMNLSPGTIFLPDNQTGFISVIHNGATVNMIASITLPLECLPVGYYVTAGGAISTLADIRDQSVGVIGVTSLPAQTSPWSPGDVKTTFRNTVESGGWLFCEGQTLNKNTYPDLFNAIGYLFGGSGNNFNLPDGRGRSLVGLGQGIGLTNRNVGYFGTEQLLIGINNLPSHSHAVLETLHTHGFIDVAHTHSIADYGHNHTLSDTGHAHRSFGDARDALIPVTDTTQTGAESSRRGGGAATFTTRSQSNVGIAPSGVNVTINASRTGGEIQANSANVTISANGGGQPIKIEPPSITIRYMIKL
jgi:microcystin-dependent protein